MKFKVHPEIFKAYPDLKFGVIILRGIDNTRRVSAVESLLRGVCAQRGREYANKELKGDPMIQPWLAAYSNFGVNPNKYAPSIAALLKRVANGKDIPHINALVDIYNYFSLKYLMPIGGEDLDWLCGNLNLSFTKGGEPFRPLGSIKVEEAKEGEVAYMDEGGITCRYWNHRECERTKFTNKTVNAAIIIEDLTNIHIDKFGEMLREMQNSMIKYIGGQIEPYILTEDNPEIDLGIKGRENIDDSKISAQEKAYFLARKQKGSEQKAKPSATSAGFTAKPIRVEKKSELKMLPDDAFKSQIKSALEIAITKAFPQAVDVDAKIEYPSDLNHGDYASNVAMQITKAIGLPPREVAEKIIEKYDKGTLIEKVEIAGPGFINFFISDAALNELTATIIEEGDKYGQTNVGKEKTILVEYSSPNIAKPLGVHHLLSTVIGQSIYNIYKNQGFKATSLNYVGDWGTQFGKLIYAYKNWGDKSTIEKDPIPELLKLYVKFHDEAEKDASIEDAARHEFKIFEEGDEENKEIWQWFVDESLKEIQKTYDKLGGIHFDLTQGESFLEDKMAEVLTDGKSKNIFTAGKEGAFIAEFDDPNMPPLVVQKKDGATLYSTRDLANLKYRVNHWHPAKILYVVDIAQTLHFKQVFATSDRFSWYHGEAEHVWFGRMHMKDGGMSTRKGKVILLDDLIDEAISRAKAIIEKKNPDLTDSENVARIVGTGSIKYSILSQNRTTDITFDWDRMLSLEGNSAPYLQYAYARARSILRKADQPVDGSIADPEDVTAKEHALTRLFPKFNETIAYAASEYKPNLLANYLYELAQAFNSFYSHVPVLKASDEDQRAKRLKIVQAASQILKNGLALLGVEVVEEM